ncbi:uncharacterized protein SPSF3K_00375 [Streptococcus parauberis]|uniref:PepSY domain-containing protein n=2 Tax=Streptococcus TaxID=1301 RepID=A0ABN0IPI1_9STRE|nr:PepSY domain-containing protein [Streptococcus parauberis]AUT05116.1 uncharacterized protein SPSF3K_00375 [Streptococcus parauberis]EMG24721.1 hypothetical protein SPJ1_1980 [Streptococcus parauberis KRS-02083]UWV10571.1 PepSY domain-containing protein [Streptococcus parauberis]WOF47083.1 PepSY domain-containing protein [Streptococcus parauberis]
MLTACSESNTGKSISEDKATDIVLKDANVKEEDTSMMSIEKDMDGTTSTYEVTFTANNKEYEYTVNAKSGEIMEKSSEN